MALTSDDLRTTYPAKVSTEINRRALWPSLCDRSLEPAAQNAYKIVAQDVTAYGPAAYAGHTVDSDWAAETRTSAAQVELEMDKIQEYNAAISWYHAKLAPIRYEQLMLQSAMQKLATAIDGSVADVLNDATWAAANTQKYGSTSVYISQAGVPTGTGADKLPYTMMRDFSLKVREDDWVDGAIVGSPIGNIWIVMPPTIFQLLADYLLDKGYGWDPLTASQLQQASILGGGRFRGRLFGIDIFTSTAIDEPAAAGAEWWCFAGTNAGLLHAQVRPLVVVVDPTVNPVAPELSIHVMAAWGTKIFQQKFLQRYEFQSDTTA